MRRLSLAALLALAACTKPIELEWVAATQGGSGCTPGLAGDLLVFGNESGYVNAVDRAGNTRWSFTAHRDVIGTPAAHGDNVLFGGVNHLFYAVNAVSGREAWRFVAKDRIKGDPLVVGDVVYFGSYDKHLYALNAKTGKPLWQFPPASAPAPAATPVVAKTGAPPAAPHVEAGEFSYAKPLVVEGVVYVGNLDGHLYAVDAQTGALQWRFKTGAGVTSGAAYGQGVLFFGSNDKSVYALDAATRAPRWTFATGDEVNASPRLLDGVLYVGGVDKTLYALDAATGKPKWTFQAKGQLLGSPAFYQNLLFIGAGPGDGRLLALDKRTGALFWSFETDSKFETDPVVDGNHVYAVVGDGRLLSFVINKAP